MSTSTCWSRRGLPPDQLYGHVTNGFRVLPSDWASDGTNGGTARNSVGPHLPHHPFIAAAWAASQSQNSDSGLRSVAPRTVTM